MLALEEYMDHELSMIRTGQADPDFEWSYGSDHPSKGERTNEQVSSDEDGFVAPRRTARPTTLKAESTTTTGNRYSELDLNPVTEEGEMSGMV